MIRIRLEQFRLMGQEEFGVRMAALLAEQFSDAAELCRDELLTGVREQVVRAQRYGFLAEQDVAVYVLTAWLLGEDFDKELPAAEQILNSGDAPEVRATRLEEWTQALFSALEEEDS